MPQLPLKIPLASKIVRSDPKNNHLATITHVQSKSLKHSVVSATKIMKRSILFQNIFLKNFCILVGLQRLSVCLHGLPLSLNTPSSLSLSISHTYTHTHTHTHLIHTNTLTHTHTYIVFLSLSPSLSLKHTQAHSLDLDLSFCGPATFLPNQVH